MSLRRIVAGPYGVLPPLVGDLNRLMPLPSEAISRTEEQSYGRDWPFVWKLG